MSRIRTYATNAERQAAYRKRLAQRERSGIVSGLPKRPGHARWNQAIPKACRLLEIVRDEMQDYFDERSERWQDSERGQDLQGRIDSLSAIVDDIDGLL